MYFISVYSMLNWCMFDDIVINCIDVRYNWDFMFEEVGISINLVIWVEIFEDSVFMIDINKIE